MYRRSSVMSLWSAHSRRRDSRPSSRSIDSLHPRFSLPLPHSFHLSLRRVENSGAVPKTGLCHLGASQAAPRPLAPQMALKRLNAKATISFLRKLENACPTKTEIHLFRDKTLNPIALPRMISTCNFLDPKASRYLP